jgi:hypothetical protein
MQWRNKKGGGGQYPVFKIEDQTCFVPNPDPYSLVNTLQKMAAKRAYVMAVIAATRSSAIFTQDLEDLPAEALGKVEEDKPPPPAAAAPAPETAKAKGSKKAADPALDGTPEQRVQFARLSVLIGDAKDLPVLESVGAACVTSRRSQNISDMQRKALAKQWDERKAEIAKGPDASLDEEGRRDWGMSGPPDGPSEEGAK